MRKLLCTFVISALLLSHSPASAEGVKEVLPCTPAECPIRNAAILVLERDTAVLHEAQAAKEGDAMIVRKPGLALPANALVGGVAFLENGEVRSSVFHSSARPSFVAPSELERGNQLREELVKAEAEAAKLETARHEKNRTLREAAGLAELDHKYEQLSLVEQELKRVRDSLENLRAASTSLKPGDDPKASPSANPSP